MAESKHTPSRRAALRDLASVAIGGGALATALRPARAGDHPDARLLTLGQELDKQLAELGPVLDESDVCKGKFMAQTEFIDWADDPEEWRRIGQETGFNDVCERAEAKWGVIDAISLKIYATPASTFAGLAVKFRAMASDCYTRGELAQPDAEMDWRPLCFARVMRDVERLAKLEA